MKYLAIILFVIVIPISAYSQAICTTQPGFVCITQAAATDMASKLDELKAARDVIAKFMVERATNVAEIASANKVIEGWKALDAINVSMFEKSQALNAMWEKAFQMAMDLNEKLMGKINAPKSVWAKFLNALKDIAILAAGISLGRGL